MADAFERSRYSPASPSWRFLNDLYDISICTVRLGIIATLPMRRKSWFIGFNLDYPKMILSLQPSLMSFHQPPKNARKPSH